MEEVTLRMLRCTAALDHAGVPYAVIGGNAVASYVGRIDKGAVRLTQDVDILLDRSDLPSAQRVLEGAGFIYNETLGVHVFLDGPQASPKEAVHVLFANEKVREDYLAPTPAVSDSVRAERYRVLLLEPLVADEVDLISA